MNYIQNQSCFAINNSSWNKSRSICGLVVRLGSCGWSLQNTQRSLQPVYRGGAYLHASDWNSEDTLPAETGNSYSSNSSNKTFIHIRSIIYILTSVTLWLVLFLSGSQQQTAGLPEDKGEGGWVWKHNNKKINDSTNKQFN